MRARVMRVDGEQGVALVMALMATTLLLTLGGALILLSSSETVIAANFRSAHEARYAADAAIERAVADLRREPDLTLILSGGLLSSFVDGPPSGTRSLIDGSTIDLGQVTNLANCNKPSACSAAELTATTVERPWGVNNPLWALYAYGPLTNMLDPGSARSPFYIVVLVGDDPSENDGDPTLDGFTAGVPNPGKGIVRVRAEAFGPRSAHSVVEAVVEQSSTELRVLSQSDAR